MIMGEMFVYLLAKNEFGRYKSSFSHEILQLTGGCLILYMPCAHDFITSEC